VRHPYRPRRGNHRWHQGGVSHRTLGRNCSKPRNLDRCRVHARIAPRDRSIESNLCCESSAMSRALAGMDRISALQQFLQGRVGKLEQPLPVNLDVITIQEAFG